MAERIGIIAFVLAFFLGPIHVRLAALPLVVFLLMCFTAPLLPSISFFLPIVSRGASEKKGGGHHL